MAKKPTISNISSGYASTTTLNNNFTALRDGFDNTLSLDGSTPNAMGADIDMNSNDILNVQSLDVQGLTIGGTSVFPNTAAISTTYATQTHTGDGSTTTFAMGYNPAIKANVDAHIDGVYQNIDTFSISGTNLTFSEAPPLNSKIEIKVPVNVTSLTNTDPAQIVYNQGGTGAQDRTLTSRLQDFVSVKDFGAVGDGVADDTAAIQAAIDACANKTLYFPTADYVIENNGGNGLTWKSNVNAYFDNANIICKNTVYGIDLTDASNVSMLGKLHLQAYPWDETNGGGLDSQETRGIGCKNTQAGGETTDNVYIEHVYGKYFGQLVHFELGTNIKIGTAEGYKLKGNTSYSIPRGNVVTLKGCSDININNIIGTEIYKVGLYMSNQNDWVDNQHVNVGNINVQLNSDDVSSLVRINSALYCNINNVIGENGLKAVSIQFNSSTSNTIDSLFIDNVISNNAVQSVVINDENGLTSTSPTNITINSIIAKNAEDEAILIRNARNVNIGKVQVDTSGLEGVKITSSENVAINNILTSETGREGVRTTGTGDRYIINTLQSTNANRLDGSYSAFRIEDANTTNCFVGKIIAETLSGETIKHQRAATVVGDFGNCKIDNITDINANQSTVISINSETFDKLDNGTLYRTAAPASGTWDQGDIVYDTTPTASGYIGFVCVSDGTPGTWKTFGAISS